MSFYNVSATAASNTTINSISAVGSASANLIDDLIRQLAAQDRQFLNDLGGNNTVGGTADAITITPSSGSITAAFDGLVIGFIAGADNTTTSPTANVGGLGAEPIKKAVAGAETAMLAGDIQSGGFYQLRWRSAWDSANGAWELISPNPLGPILIASASPSAVATVEFTDLPSGYRSFMLEASLQPATDDDYLALRVGTGATPTWQTGSSAYAYAGQQSGPGGVADFGSSLDSSIGSLIALTRPVSGQGVGNGSGEHAFIKVFFEDPAVSGLVRIFSWHGGLIRSDAFIQSVTGSGVYASTTAVTAIRLFFSSGNVADGEVRLYGFRG